MGETGRERFKLFVYTGMDLSMCSRYGLLENVQKKKNSTKREKWKKDYYNAVSFFLLIGVELGLGLGMGYSLHAPPLFSPPNPP